ncbi:hypothetical protein GA0111570_11390 [Raineyella antarctica]|uniref:Uncharacterized protein n=1 Tax=Raineyella antarctica TaxID=1577474 RepID=A0A1G6I0I0_9ACTN|nr:hypothetical protein [Raineyella antarctica]SDB99883.1 hypothetical protein GA0111570_11390 [Raineyella antarctica]
MASRTDDPDDKSLGDLSPAEIFRRGSTRAKVVKELSLWIVAAVSAGAGALGMQVGGSWGWSFLWFAVTLVVMMFLRAQVLRAISRRAGSATAAAMAAERQAEEMAAALRREERAARQKEAAHRPRKPRANPYRKKSA